MDPQGRGQADHPNLHSCFIQGWADVDKDRDIAVITDKGRAVVSSYLEI